MKKALKSFAVFAIFACIFFPTKVYADTTHTVVKGDTLGSIAKQYYGDASKWQEVFESNKDVIKDPNLISVGWILKIKDKSKKEEPIVSRGSSTKEVLTVRATAYDLSVASCGKKPSHPQYGLTRSGRQIDGLTRTQAACVAVDPKVIPLGSLLYISFDDPTYEQYNDVYQALDTGGGVRGNHVDIFLGDFNSTSESFEVRQFGVKKARVVILREGW